MNYHVVYEPDFSRILPAIIIECRASIPEIKNQVGSVIKSFTDSQVSLIGENCIFYKVETDLGNIAMVFAISVNTQNKTANLLLQYIRPAFQENSIGMSNIVINFITSNNWYADFLF